VSTKNLFDEIARLVGSGIPRRRMLRLSLSSLAAAALGHFSAEKAWAWPCPAPNVRCTPNGICCTPGSCDKDGFCCDAPGKEVCSGGDCCDSGKCAGDGKCCDSADRELCGSDNRCCPLGMCNEQGECKSPFPGCTAATCETFIPCSTANSDCVCGSIAEGGGFCVPGSTPCAGLPACTTSADCSPGSICLVDTCCGAGVCISAALECAATSSAPATKASGPTIGHR
jgi:hypothetical protein